MNKSIIVTGGAGFIGSCIVSRLNSCGLEEILIVDKMRNNGKEKNIEGKKFLDLIDKQEFIDKVQSKPSYYQSISTVFHMGACSSTLNLDKEYLKKNNTEYSIELAKWCLNNGIKYIYASSGATYGDGGQGFTDNVNELESLQPLNPYGQSKHDFDLWVKKNKLFDKLLGIKFFNVFGPNEYHKGEMRSVIHKAFPCVRDEGVMKLFKSYKEGYKDGEQKRDFIYIKDALDVMMFFLERKDISGLFNLGRGQAETWNAVAESMFNALDKPVNIEYIDMPDELQPRYQYLTEADMSKLRNCGYDKDFTSLQDSIKDYIVNHLHTNNPYY